MCVRGRACAVHAARYVALSCILSCVGACLPPLCVSRSSIGGAGLLWLVLRIVLHVTLLAVHGYMVYVAQNYADEECEKRLDQWAWLQGVGILALSTIYVARAFIEDKIRSAQGSAGGGGLGLLDRHQCVHMCRIMCICDVCVCVCMYVCVCVCVYVCVLDGWMDGWMCVCVCGVCFV